MDDDTSGFGIRLHGGRHKWTAQLRILSRTRRISIDDVGRIASYIARAIASPFFAEIILCTDP